MQDLYCVARQTDRGEFHLEDVYITGKLIILLHRKCNHHDFKKESWMF